MTFDRENEVRITCHVNHTEAVSIEPRQPEREYMQKNTLPSALLNRYYGQIRGGVFAPSRGENG